MTIVMIIIMSSSMSGNDKTLFEQANTAYYQGHYEQAITDYQQLISGPNGKNPALFFNLGNAFFKNGEIGKAIMYYEAALLLDSRFEPARQNLESALKKTKRNLPRPDQRLLGNQNILQYYPLSPGQSLLLCHGALLGALLLLVVRYHRDSVRLKWLYRLAPVMAVLLFALALGANYAPRSSAKMAVTVISEAPVYFSMSELDSPRFLLYEGDRVLADRFDGDWVRVHAHDGERGWTQKDNIGIVEYSGI